MLNAYTKKKYKHEEWIQNFKRIIQYSTYNHTILSRQKLSIYFDKIQYCLFHQIFKKNNISEK